VSLLLLLVIVIIQMCHIYSFFMFLLFPNFSKTRTLDRSNFSRSRKSLSYRESTVYLTCSRSIKFAQAQGTRN